MSTRVLLVDDEEDFLQLLTLRLRRRRLRVSCAATGEAALEVLARTPADVVVLDMRLPGMDGLATLRRIRAEYPGVRVIMLTGFADPELVEQARQLGVCATLLKPVEVTELCAHIERAAAQPPPATHTPGEP